MKELLNAFVEYFTTLSGMKLVAQISGFVVIFFNFLIFQQKDRKSLLKAKRRADLVAALSYVFFVLSGNPLAWASVFQCLIASIRETVFLNNDKKWARSKLWLLGFLVLFYISSFVTWGLNKNSNVSVWLNFLPAIASTIAIVSYWIGNPRLNRVLQIPTSLIMLIYEFNILAVASILSEIFTVSSSMIGMIRLDIMKVNKTSDKSVSETNE